MDPFEYNYLRQYNSKTFFRNSQIEIEIHGKWIHYFDRTKTWKDIDTDFVDKGNFFGMDKANFEVEAPKLSTGIAKFISSNRWDIFEKKEITDPPFTQSIRAIDVAEVEGKIEEGNLGWGHVNYVIYPNAYPKYNADLIYYVHFGRAPVLKKLIRFNSDPNLIEDIRLEFEFSYSEDCEIKCSKEVLTQRDLIKIKSHFKKDREIE
ncbi:MAG: hypothetical protein IH948_08200, partial [Bacteroidetes bacterium]|nr:hypothetical protein [Bacteroidota bacterium]